MGKPDALKGNGKAGNALMALMERGAATELARDLAEVVVEVFSKMHPGVVMNFGQWLDLKEAIEREVRGNLDGSGVSAGDLLHE